MSSGISFGGIASGMDTNALIDGLVGVERLRVRRIEAKKSETSGAISDYSELISKLNSLKKIAEEMADDDGFGELTASSSDEDVLKVSSNGLASEGNYDIEVQKLAKASKVMSNSFADSTTAGLAGAGSLDITVDGTTTSIAVDGTMALTDIRAAINASGAEVNASIINENGNARLLVTGKKTGLDNAVTFTESGTLALNLSDPANELGAADDARIVLDGALTIDSPDNSISGVIEGVTFDLRDADPGTQINVSLTRNNDGQAERFQEFISAYNDVLSFIDVKTRARTSSSDEKKADRRLLVNDSTMRGVEQTLRNILQNTIPGNANFPTASAIGIKTDSANGLLTLDRTAFDKALEKDFSGVLNVFSKDTDGLADLFTDAIDLITKDDGILDSRKDSLSGRLTEFDRQIDRQNRRIDAFEQRLRNQFLAMEQTISSLNGQAGFLQSNLIGF